MSRELIELNIRKLTVKLEKTVNDCLLKGSCVQELHDLSPRQEFNYTILDTEKTSPVKVPIFNSQIYAIGQQISRLEKQLKAFKEG